MDNGRVRYQIVDIIFEKKPLIRVAHYECMYYARMTMQEYIEGHGRIHRGTRAYIIQTSIVN